jgi:hypothetical protein
MCKKCNDIREKMELCQRMLRHGLDELTAERLSILLEEYKAQLAAMDCQRRCPPSSG